MREAAFIKKNKEKWTKFEAEISGKTPPEAGELSRMYIQILNDLSYARTYYPKSKLKSYLNGLASQIFFKIYGTRPTDTNRIVYFFKTEVPILAYRYRPFLKAAFVFFFIFVSIGVISSAFDDRFIRLILGDAYVNMTLDNIRNGDPVAVYKTGPAWASHIAITLNNLKVGLIAYVSGIFAGIGTLYVLFQNAVMLGAFQYMFYKHGVLWPSVRGIWIHGSMEIFAMVVEAAAGLILGAGLLFPGSFSRKESLIRAARDSIKLFISTMPFTAAAALLEGYITRFASDMPAVLAWLIILSTLGFIFWYYFIYPLRVARQTGLYQKIKLYDFI
ncbi:MAG: stage II sporulation protein M [Chlorobi bacterium]|nr:stage II sporulation protein M [Chlorobiota bacterium]